jgi:FAD/FMN-containing dehydrogenase
LSPPIGGANVANLVASFGMPPTQMATEVGGSFAAEHGSGRSTIALSDHVRTAAERDLMKSLKRLPDPAGW